MLNHYIMSLPVFGLGASLYSRSITPLGVTLAGYAVLDLNLGAANAVNLINQISDKATSAASYNLSAGIKFVNSTIANEAYSMRSRVFSNCGVGLFSALLSLGSYYFVHDQVNKIDKLNYKKQKHGEQYNPFNEDSQIQVFAKLTSLAPIFCCFAYASPFMMLTACTIQAARHMYNNYSEGKNPLDSTTIPYLVGIVVSIYFPLYCPPETLIYIANAPLTQGFAFISGIYSTVIKMLGQYEKQITNFENIETELRHQTGKRINKVFDDFNKTNHPQVQTHLRQKFNQLKPSITAIGELNKAPDNIKPILTSMLAAKYTNSGLKDDIPSEKLDLLATEFSKQACYPINIAGQPAVNANVQLANKCQALTSGLVDAMSSDNKFNIDHFLDTQYVKLLTEHNTANVMNPGNQVQVNELTKLEKTQIKEFYAEMVYKIDKGIEDRQPKQTQQSQQR